MPKPGTLPRWATDLTNNDAPSAGQMDTGWTPGQTGVSDYDNYIKYWTYKWIEFINPLFGTNALIEPSTTFWQPALASGPLTSSVTHITAAGGGVVSTAGSATFVNVATANLKPGDIITGISARLSGTGSITVQLWTQEGTSYRKIAEMITNNPGTSAVFSTSSGASLPYTMADSNTNHGAWWYVEITGASTSVYALGITKNNPGA